MLQVINIYANIYSFNDMFLTIDAKANTIVIVAKTWHQAYELLFKFLVKLQSKDFSEIIVLENVMPFTLCKYLCMESNSYVIN